MIQHLGILRIWLTLSLPFLSMVPFNAFSFSNNSIATGSLILASLDDPTDSTGITFDSSGQLTNDFSNQNKYNTPVTVEPPQYTRPPFNTTGGGNYGGRVQDGTPFRGNYSWEPQNEEAARVGAGQRAPHQLEGTPFRGNYHWEEGQSGRTPGGAISAPHQLEGTPFRGNYHWEAGQSGRTPGGATSAPHQFEGTPYRGNYYWEGQSDRAPVGVQQQTTRQSTGGTSYRGNYPW